MTDASLQYIKLTYNKLRKYYTAIELDKYGNQWSKTI